MNTAQAPSIVEPLTVTPSEEDSQASTPGRLVVVVPDVAEPALLAGRIHLVAHARRREVLIVGVASQVLSEAELRRKLTLLAAFLQEAGTKAPIQVEKGNDWIPRIQSLLGDDDILACCVDEGLPEAGDRWIELLATRLQRNVYAFMDSGGLRVPKPRLAARLAPWLGSIAIILGFFWLQVWLSQPGAGAAFRGWLLPSVPVEIGLIWLFNSILG